MTKYVLTPEAEASPDVYDLIALIVSDPEEDCEWKKDAACAGLDPDLWMPKRGERTDLARSICDICPVKTPCRIAGVRNRERVGIWGGMSQRERRRGTKVVDLDPE